MNSEQERRWISARRIMHQQNVDVVIAFSDFGDQSSFARYLANFRSSYDYQAVLLYRDDGCDLILTHAGGIPIAKQLAWATDVLPMAVPATRDCHNSGNVPSVGGQIANRLHSRQVRRVGILGFEYFPSGWRDLILEAIPDAEIVNLWDDFHHLRLVKGASEQDLIREACRISDAAWEAMPDIVRVGRKRYEVLADIEHILRLNGCEDSFNLCMSLPMLAERMDRNPYSALPIETDSVYLIEVSPRYLGYFGQQTGLVATGRIPDQMQRAYDAVNRARDVGLELAKPGADLAQMGLAIAQSLKADGFEPASPSFGHAVGLELEDWHINGSSLVLEEGMTFIFHPMAAGHPAVMRADTYLITAQGPERLTGGDIKPLIIA